MEIHVLQGERQMAADNRTLGKFHLIGIPPAPRGMPKVEVTFNIDADGIVNVSAKDTATGKEQSIKIEASSGVSEEEIERMVDDAEAHGEEDRLKKETVEVRNRLDSLVYDVDKNLKENRDKIEEDDEKNIEDALEKGREAINGSDKDEMESTIEEISKASHKLAEVLYQAAQGEAEAAEGEPAASGDPAGSDDDVVDAEYTDTEA